MEFKIISTYYHDSTLLDQYPCLTEFGFEMRQETAVRKQLILDEKRKPIFQCTPYIDEHPIVKIDSLEQLIALRDAVEQELIIGDTFIEIYDSYRE